MNIKHWLFLRGLGREQGHWGDFIQRCEVQLGWHCHCLDLPGFGSEHQRPSPTRISEIRHDLQQRLPEPLKANTPFGVVALSLGGMVALDWLATTPEQIAKIIFINTSTGDCPLFQRVRFAALPTALSALLAPHEHQRERAALKMVSNHHANDPALLQAWYKISTAQAIKKINVLRQLFAAARYRAPSELPGASQLLISSRADRMVSYQCSEYLAAKYRWPLVLHNSAGHDLPIDDPAWLIEVFKRNA
jgi:pimeloyl-[acyl-carrier protein] methyl ester esterase